ncbi:MAG TPA: DUF4337 family protein [Bryobacteraceae bacterium]|nr:DUF4337 family protein [Bryobacteraceae bacterium]
MSVTEELTENTEHARAPFDKKVAASMAIIAAALAVVSVFGQLFANEELLKQAKASDQWAYYQAKSIRRYESDIARDLFGNLSGAAAAKGAAKYATNMERYQKESEEVQNEARGLERESEFRGRQALRMHIGEIFLEIGIVFASLAILAKRNTIWIASLVSAAVGGGIAVTTIWLH